MLGPIAKFSILVLILCSTETFAKRRKTSSKTLSTEDGGVTETNKTLATKEGKLLPIFQVITFKNGVCNAGSKNGTCFTSAECSSKGGSNSGKTCASGFGICCTFAPGCGTTTSQNLTYLESGSASTTSSGQCAYTICKCSSNICRIRFDFDTFVIQDPATFTQTSTSAQTIANSVGDCLTDRFSITSPGGMASPVICGTNTGQHMYMDASEACHKVTFDLGSTAGSWSIKVTQFECGDITGGPDNCLQYFTGTTGQIKSYNYPTNPSSQSISTTHLSSQCYSICIRSEVGYCGVCFTEVETNSFGLSVTPTITTLQSTAGTSCNADYLEIAGATAPPFSATDSSTVSRFCGQNLNIASASATQASVCTAQRPYRLIFKTDQDEVAAATGTPANNEVAGTPVTGGQIGFDLYYIQQSCT